MRPDVELDQIGILKRREIEARILAPVIEALAREFGKDKVLESVRQAIIEIARTQGRSLVEHLGGNDIQHLKECVRLFTKEDALQIEILESGEDDLSFNVHRCRYAELYRSLAIPELGKVLSCSRDFAFVDGFNPEIDLRRTQTIMEGADYCDFRFRHNAKQNVEPKRANQKQS